MRELAGEKLKITPDARNAVKKFLATPQSISLLLATTASSSGYSSISWILVNSCYSSTASTLAVISTTRTNWAASEFFRQFVKWCVKYTWAIADWCAYHELITENQTYCACAGEDDWGRGEAAVFLWRETAIVGLWQEGSRWLWMNDRCPQPCRQLYHKLSRRHGHRHTL